jgi:hypothetical protein
VSEYAIRPLEAATWDAFVHLAEKHNGVWNGCWCTWFHPACAERGVSPEGNRAYKERLVRQGKAHAALVFDGDVAVAWREYGSPDELPNIYLNNGTRSLFEKGGFSYEWSKGKNHCVMRRMVSPS